MRMRQEGREGKYMCRYIVHSMWEDVEQRSKIMGVSFSKRQSINLFVTIVLNPYMFNVMKTDISGDLYNTVSVLSQYLLATQSS